MSYRATVSIFETVEWSVYEHRRDAIIAAALAKPPPAPADCVLRSLDLGTPTPLALRVPAQNHIPTMHIRMAHERAGNGHANRQEYNDALQAEYSRLQDSQPWYWDQLWPGGIALARHLLSNDELVRGRTVLEFGAGIGLLACATARSGASLVAAVDIEPTALEFIRQSAADNGLPAGSVHAIQWDWDEPPPPAVVEAAGPTGALMWCFFRTSCTMTRPSNGLAFLLPHCWHRTGY